MPSEESKVYCRRCGNVLRSHESQLCDDCLEGDIINLYPEVCQEAIKNRKRA